MAPSDMAIHSALPPRLGSLAGIALREDSLFTNSKGKDKSGTRKRAEKTIEKLQQPLHKLLKPDEAVLYLASAQAPRSILEHLTSNVFSYYASRTVLVFTNRRLLHFLVKGNGEWRQSIRSLRWGDVLEAKSRASLFSSSLVLKYADGKKETYTALRRADARKIKLLLSLLLPASRAELSPAQAMVALCPECFAQLLPGVYRCSHCGLAFKEEATMIRRSFLIPGGGYFYCRQKLLGGLAFLVELYLTVMLLILLLDTLAAPRRFLAAFIAVGLIFLLEKLITIHHCRRLIRNYIPDPSQAPAQLAGMGTAAGGSS